jgi:hypothetical protein
MRVLASTCLKGKSCGPETAAAREIEQKDGTPAAGFLIFPWIRAIVREDLEGETLT